MSKLRCLLFGHDWNTQHRRRVVSMQQDGNDKQEVGQFRYQVCFRCSRQRRVWWRPGQTVEFL